jgi:hypothetical protein
VQVPGRRRSSLRRRGGHASARNRPLAGSPAPRCNHHLSGRCTSWTPASAGPTCRG